MPKIIEAKLLAEGKKFSLIVSRFNDFISDRLLEGALDALLRSGAKDEDIDVVKVPGAFEIPLMAKKMAETIKNVFFEFFIFKCKIIKLKHEHSSKTY